MNKTVILGAAGAIGKAVAADLARRGQPFRVAGRNLKRLQDAFGHLPNVEMVAADIETTEGAARAVAEMDTAIFTVGITYTEFHRYPPLMRTVVAASEAAGVRRFLLVTNIYPYGLPETELVDETHPLNPVAFKGKMRLEQEQILQRSTRMQWIVLRLPDFYGPDAELSYAHMIFTAAAAGKKAQLFEPADTPHQFIFTPDAGQVVGDLLAKETGWNETYNFAGSGLITVEDFARRIYAASGQKYRRMLVAPWMLWLIGLFSPLIREFREMGYLMTTPVNLNDDKLVTHLGRVQRTSYEEGIAATLRASRGA